MNTAAGRQASLMKTALQAAVRLAQDIVRRVADESPVVLLFVHGFNTTLEGATAIAAGVNAHLNAEVGLELGANVTR